MNPNDQQGFYRPEPAQPAQPTQPAQPIQSGETPVAQEQSPVAPVAGSVAVNETVAAPAVSAQEQPEDGELDGEFDDELDDDDFSDENLVNWTAHEYIHQEKGTMWFILFAVVIAASIAVSLFLMKSITFAVLLAVIAVVVVVYSRRPPRELNYSLTSEGLYIDEKLHKFEAFKSFGVIHDGDEFSVMLIPVQRFQPGITVYFPEESGEAIVDMLGSRLPMKDLKLDVVDRIVRLLRL